MDSWVDHLLAEELRLEAELRRIRSEVVSWRLHLEDARRSAPGRPPLAMRRRRFSYLATGSATVIDRTRGEL